MTDQRFGPARTFHPRRRKLSPTRAAVVERAFPQWSLAVQGPPLAVEGEVVLEIGPGTGATTLALADAQPDLQVIACEVYNAGIANLLAGIEARGLTNLRIVEGDALEFIDRLGPASLAGLRIFHPDPWPKRRQEHRRLVRPVVLDALVPLVRPGGFVHLTTDVADYARQMQRVCDAHPSLTGGPIPRPAWRPETAFEARGEREGRPTVDLWYEVTP